MKATSTTARRGAALLTLWLGACGSVAPLAPDGGAGAPDGGAGVDAGPGEASSVADAPASATLPDGRCKVGAFVHGSACTCQDDIPTPCESSCADLTRDDDNCGACGHACGAGSACAGGVCGPVPKIFAARAAPCGAMRLAADLDNLYWTDTAGGRVMKAPLGGGAPTPVSGAETTSPSLLFVKGASVLWLDGKTIRSSRGGAISSLTTSATDVLGLATSDDGETVYFSTGAKVQSVPAAGGATPTDVEVHNSGNPAALAVQGNILASTVALVGGVNVIGLGGPLALCWTEDPMGEASLDVDCTRVARGQGGLVTDVVAATASKVLWIDDMAIKMGDLVVLPPGQLRAWDPVVQDDLSITSMTVAGDVVYFDTIDTSDGTGAVKKAPITANGPAGYAIARGVHGPGSLAVGRHQLYWTTADCEIQSTPTGDVTNSGPLP
jgi:hypothetical protein